MTAPTPTTDAECIVRAVTKLYPPATGETTDAQLSWQAQSTFLLHAVGTAMCGVRRLFKDGSTFTPELIHEFLAMPAVERLYIRGLRQAVERGGEWSDDFKPIQSYLAERLPGYQPALLAAKHGMWDAGIASNSETLTKIELGDFEQLARVYEHHAFVIGQLTGPLFELQQFTAAMAGQVD